MRVSSGTATGKIEESLKILEDIFKETDNSVKEAERKWSDNVSRQFVKKYVNPFMEIQQKTIGEIKSILVNVHSIETMLNNNK
jgi:hypothetical protein